MPRDRNTQTHLADCSVLRCVAALCSVLGCVGVCCSVLQCVAVQTHLADLSALIRYVHTYRQRVFWRQWRRRLCLRAHTGMHTRMHADTHVHT